MARLPAAMTRDLDLAALGPYWERARGWWAGRSRREQVLLAVLGALAILALLIWGIIGPLQDTREESLGRIRQAELLEARLRAAPAGSPVQMRSGTASAVVTDAAAAVRLPVGQIDEQAGAARLSFSAVPFEALLRFVSELERTSAMRVVQADITAQGAPGLVDAQMTVQ